MRARTGYIIMVSLLYGQGLLGLIAVGAVIHKERPIVVEEASASTHVRLALSGDVVTR
ncbi:MAG: hypothetical protein Q8Q62_00380 [Mesorhizobium sp.]|nr:hypothetical protein [Mesorhizobium sp.]